MKVLLINPIAVRGELRRHGADTHPPLGLLYVATMLKKAGHNVEVLDNEFLCLGEQELKEMIRKINPGMVGISVFTPKYESLILTAKVVKAVDKNITVVAGGPHPSILPRETLEKLQEVDIVVMGEGEHTSVELVNSLEKKISLRQIKGIGYRENGRILINSPRPLIENLDEIPIPSREFFADIKLRKSSFRYKRLPFSSVITSRGCPYRCIFCYNGIFGKVYRTHSVERVIEEIEYLVNRYGFKEIQFVDDLFLFDPQRTERICDLLIRKKIDITWSGNGRVDILYRNRHIIPKLKKAGCWYISFGLESSSQEVLDFIKKNIKLHEVEAVIRWLHDAGIFTKGYFMIGHPIDTKETIRKTIDFAKRICLDTAQFAIVTPYPKTELCRIAPRYGTLESEGDNYGRLSSHSSEPTFVPKGLTKEYLIETQRQAYREFYFRPVYLLRQLKNIRSPETLLKYVRTGWSYFQNYVLGKGY